MNSRETPTDWAQRYAEGDTPWDRGVPHPELAARLARGELTPPVGTARALIPGCGPGHDALALARVGWDVIAVDQVPALAGSVGKALEPLGGRFHLGDALEWSPEEGEGALQLLFDHTFLCAIDPRDRPRFGSLASRALEVGGSLVCLLFPVGKPIKEGGPPFALDLNTLAGLLGTNFVLKQHEPVAHPVADRDYEEFWVRFERRA